MKAMDRFRVIKRAVLVALNPKLEILKISYVDKQNNVFTRYIHDNRVLVKQLFLSDMERMFTQRAKNAKSLETMLVNFVDGIQNRWNAEHPDDLLQIVKERETPDENDDNQLAQESCVGIYPDSSVLPDVSVTDRGLNHG